MKFSHVYLDPSRIVTEHSEKIHISEGVLKKNFRERERKERGRECVCEREKNQFFVPFIYAFIV